MDILVQKFGGTSVANPERIINVAKRVIAAKDKGKSVVVVVSAMGDSTDDLIDLAFKVNPRPSAREFDMLLATGEQVSISLLAMAINSLGHEAISLTGPQAGIQTESFHGKARILNIDTTRVLKELGAGKIVIVAGFQGISQEGNITTLGRGGSDTTAVALAAALESNICEIYTDVDGVYTTNPRLVAEASKLETISYDEMLELASLGAQVLHPRSVELGKHYGVQIHVRSSFNPVEGTIVKECKELENKQVVSGVAYDTNVAKIALLEIPNVPGISFKIFQALADENIDVDIIVQSIGRDGRIDISFTLPKTDLERAVEILKEKVINQIGAKNIVSESNIAKLSIVGAGMVSRPGVAAKMFEALAKENINIEMISTSEIKVSCVVEDKDIEKGVKSIHQHFNLDKK